MSTLEYIAGIVAPAALKMLPARMDSMEARAMLLAIGLQESRFKYRRQVGGPARGFWQFENGGGWKGVTTHPASQQAALNTLSALGYGLDDFATLEHNDILACVFARLLLWTHPRALPQRWQVGYAWEYYLETWRPGKPRRESWDGFYEDAWGLVS